MLKVVKFTLLSLVSLTSAFCSEEEDFVLPRPRHQSPLEKRLQEAIQDDAAYLIREWNEKIPAEQALEFLKHSGGRRLIDGIQRSFEGEAHSLLMDLEESTSLNHDEKEKIVSAATKLKDEYIDLLSKIPRT